MLKQIGIKSLYTPALAEGEGVGTAYEYFAKRLVLSGWLRGLPRPRSVLIAGLPEKYGSSLDFFVLADELDTAVTVVDDRHEALNKARWSIGEAQKAGWLQNISPAIMPVRSLPEMAELSQTYDLVLSSEVLQRLPAEDRPHYVARVQELSRAAALFAPNADNDAHVGISGLGGVTLQELAALAEENGRHQVAQTGYIDMPPFPPGITRSESQRAQANTGLLEGVAMWGLGIYAKAERFFPLSLRRKQSHIVYALMQATKN